MTQKLTPLFDQVVIICDEPVTVTNGGFIIPDNVAEKPDQGTVIAIGAGKRCDNGELITPTVQINDKVLFPKNAGNLVKVNGQEVIILRENEIFAVITD